ncbi:hypothetical protein JW926_01740, partial [Candidatus Sumerlaeota bacterium]|nr:hypothetical protein [Candidatus Sumerlaeota bacterium]
ERKDESTIFLVDCSQSMVSGIHKDMESKELLKMYSMGHNILISLPAENLDKYMSDPANEGIITSSELYKACEILEDMIENYGRGPVDIIAFHEGIVDMDRGGPYAKVFSGYIDPDKPETKKRFLQFINPEKHGKSPEVPFWNGILWETIKKGGGPTKINTSCKYAMSLFNKKLKKPGFRDALKYQRLVVLTDGKEMEKKSDFNKVKNLYKLEDKGKWYEYRDSYVVEKVVKKETPVVVTRKAKISVSANAMKGTLKQDDLKAPEFKGEVALLPALRVILTGEGDFIPRGSVAIALSQAAKDVPAPMISPIAIENRAFGKDVSFEMSYSGAQSFIEKLSQPKDLKYALSLEYKPASGENIQKEDIPRLSVPVTVKMVPSEKTISIVPPAGFEAKPAPDGVIWELADGKRIQGQFGFSVDFSKAPLDAKLEIELKEDQRNKALSLKKSSEPGKVVLTPGADKKAGFEIGIDLSKSDEKLTGVMTAKASPAKVKAEPEKTYFSITNPVKVYKFSWKDQQKQDMAAPQSIDFGKIRIKKIRTGEYVKPAAHGFVLQPELEAFSSIDAPIDVMLEGTIIAAMGLKVEDGVKPETRIKDCPPNKIVSLAFRQNLKPGVYTGKIIAKTTSGRTEIQPSGAVGIPIQVQLVGMNYLWLIIIIIALLLLILLFALKGRKEEKKPVAPIAKPEGGA